MTRKCCAASLGKVGEGQVGEALLDVPGSFLPAPPPQHRWSLTHPEHYALQFADGHRKYITENVSPPPSPTFLRIPLTHLVSIPWFHSPCSECELLY